MELLDSYLKAVGKGLPEAQREDILRELSEDIRAEMEEREAELRRSLTKEEQQAVLKQRGNPLLLAARYRQDSRALVIGRELVGPALFPFYVKVLSFNLGLTFVIIGAIFMALVIGGQKISIHEVVSTALLQLFIQLSVITVIFAAVQKNMKQSPERWNVGGSGGLRFDFKTDKDVSAAGPKSSARVSRFESISTVIASAVGVVWLKEVQLHPFLIFGPAAYFMRLGPIWNQAIPLIIALACLEIARAIVMFLFPASKGFHAAGRIATTAVHLGITLFLLKAGTWVTLADTPGSESFAGAVRIVNNVFFYGLLAGAVVATVQLISRIARRVREQRGGTASSSVDVVC